MTTKSKDNQALINDPELAQLIEQCDAANAELKGKSPEEVSQRINANLGLPADASEAEMERALQVQLLGDPDFVDSMEKLSQLAKESTLLSLPKVKIDESFFEQISLMLGAYDGLPPAERRKRILALNELGADATDIELEAAVRKDIADNAAEPPSPQMVQRIVDLNLNKARI